MVLTLHALSDLDKEAHARTARVGLAFCGVGMGEEDCLLKQDRYDLREFGWTKCANCSGSESGAPAHDPCWRVFGRDRKCEALVNNCTVLFHSTCIFVLVNLKIKVGKLVQELIK